MIESKSILVEWSQGFCAPIILILIFYYGPSIIASIIYGSGSTKCMAHNPYVIENLLIRDSEESILFHASFTDALSYSKYDLNEALLWDFFHKSYGFSNFIGN